MSNEMYRVDVRKVGKNDITLRLVIQDAESGNLPETKAWALMLAHEALYTKAVKNAIAEKATAKLKGEKEYVKHAKSHVASVELVKSKNFPVKNERRYNETDASRSERTAAWGEYRIAFTDAAWLKGWKPGISWQSTSYAPPEKLDVEPVPVVKSTEKRVTYCFAGKRFTKLRGAQRAKLLKSIDAVELPELTTAVKYLILADNDRNHPDLKRAWTISSTGISVMTESELIEYAAELAAER